MSIRIAIPVPSSDEEYNAQSFAPYLAALQASGAEPVVVPMSLPPAEIARMIATTTGVLLPGSRFDVEPERYNHARQPECGPADPARTAMDELLLQDAFNLKKPVLAICHGCQSLNVWCGGTLVQHLTDGTNHRAGRETLDAHPLQIDCHSRLSSLSPFGSAPGEQVNSTHHQAVCRVGDRLMVAAVSPADGVVEAVELVARDHFVLGVQWHPERTFEQKEFSRALFAAFVAEAAKWQVLDQQEGASNGE